MQKEQEIWENKKEYKNKERVEKDEEKRKKEGKVKRFLQKHEWIEWEIIKFKNCSQPTKMDRIRIKQQRSKLANLPNQ